MLYVNLLILQVLFAMGQHFKETLLNLDMSNSKINGAHFYCILRASCVEWCEGIQTILSLAHFSYLEPALCTWRFRSRAGRSFLKQADSNQQRILRKKKLPSHSANKARAEWNSRTFEAARVIRRGDLVLSVVISHVMQLNYCWRVCLYCARVKYAPQLQKCARLIWPDGPNDFEFRWRTTQSPLVQSWDYFWLIARARCPSFVALCFLRKPSIERGEHNPCLINRQHMKTYAHYQRGI
jgi:hypothetical protein